MAPQNTCVNVRTCKSAVNAQLRMDGIKFKTYPILNSNVSYSMIDGMSYRDIYSYCTSQIYTFLSYQNKTRCNKVAQRDVCR